MENIEAFLRLQKLGEEIIIRAMSSAVFVLTTSSHSLQKTFEAQQCLFFLKGSGLDNTINFFQLETDPDLLRQEFFKYVKRR